MSATSAMSAISAMSAMSATSAISAISARTMNEILPHSVSWFGLHLLRKAGQSLVVRGPEEPTSVGCVLNTLLKASCWGWVGS